MAARDVIEFYQKMKARQAANARKEAAKRIGYAREAMNRVDEQSELMGKDLMALTPSACSGLLYEARVLKSRLDELIQAIAEAQRLEEDAKEFQRAIEFDQANGAQ